MALAAMWLLWSSPALAHTELVETRPGDREVIADPVNRIELEFSGALDLPATSVRVLDADGSEIPVTTTHVSETLVAIQPEFTLEGSRFAVLWSVRSASDGHELSGSFTFEAATAGSSAGSGSDIGDEPDTESAPIDEQALNDEPVADDTSPETADSVEAPSATPAATPSVAASIDVASVEEEGAASDLFGWLGRWVAMIGAIVGVGAIGFAATSLVGTATEVRRAASWIRIGGLLILVGSIVEMVAIATSHGHSLAAALMPWTWIDVLPTAQAYAMVLRIAGGIAMLQSPRLVVTSPGRPVSDPFRSEDLAASDDTRGPVIATAARTDTDTGNRLEIQHEWVTIAGAVMVIVSFGLDGHTADAGLIGRFASMTHVLAAGIWAGGLVVMADLLIRRHRSSKPTDAAAVTVRFSRVASAALVLTAVAGGVLAWSLVDEPSELWSGAWGRTLGVKLALVAVAAAIGAYNHFRVVPHLDGPETPSSDTLRRTVALEALLVIAVLAVTAVLVTAAP